MLITDEVTIMWHPTNIERYTALGYAYSKTKQPFSIKINHLAPSSHSKVKIKCDYCEGIYETTFDKYNRAKQSSSIKKDACNGCKTKKTRETNRLLYGYEIPIHRKEIAERMSEKRRLSFDVIVEEFKKRGYELISQDYKNNRQKLIYVCPKHRNKGLLQITWNDLQQGKGCRYCGNEESAEKQSMTFEFIKSEFDNRGYELVTAKYTSKVKLQYICPKHRDKGILEIFWGHFQQGKGCRYCRDDNFRGENNPNWKGGVTNVSLALRPSATKKWREQSMSKYNHKCILTNEPFLDGEGDEVHHIYNYCNIFDEMLAELQIKVKMLDE